METIASACLVASGVPIEQAALAGKSLGGVTKGFSLSEDNATDAILSSLEKSIIAALDSDSFELSEDCRELLKTDVLSPKRIIKFMCKSDSNKSLKERIIQICMQDPNCDINRKYFHDISRLRDVLYQVSEEIAYHMYQKGNQSFCLSDHEVSKIVERLSSQIHILKHANMQDITERCYALCCYWKANSNRGAVEFLHNNIRDFFLAEKVYREMDDITRTAKNENYTLELYCEQVAQKLSSLFQHGVLETKVCEFIYLRALYNAEKKNLILQSMNIRSRQSQPSLPVCPETIFTKIYWQKTPI